MSLPPGFLDELRSRLSLGQVVGRKVSWDTRKSNPGRGDLWAPCPFHQEKTASFHVDDKKGFYYCFGCHAKGDAISFVRETENVDFIEAVRMLAAEVGLSLPDPDPRAREKADRRGTLTEVMEAAQRFFRLQLAAQAGAEARAYLTRRGMDAATQEAFGIGYAPGGWQALFDHLTGKGIAEDQILACGLASTSKKGKRPYDVFRNRLMFPIRDPRGSVIAFGGRALAADEPAKYINSPQTELFDKSRTLYNLGPARSAAGKGQTLIVTEGYMDVIALHAAGFEAAVAPLGTAMTEPQLALLWRLADEPVIALDGDRAGRRAAERLIDLALPLLVAGRSLRFVLLPEGRDPDDLIRAEGPAAMQALIDEARPMVDLLWERETRDRNLDSPERRAGFDKALREVLGRISDAGIRAHYKQAFQDRRWQLFRAAGPRKASRWQSRGKGGRFDAPAQPQPDTRSSLLAQGGANAVRDMRVTLILVTLAATPELLEEFETALIGLSCTDPELAILRDLLVVQAESGGTADAAALNAEISARLGPAFLESRRQLSHVRLAASTRRAGDAHIARLTIAEELAKITAEEGLAAELSEAIEDLGDLSGESVTWRLSQAVAARDRAARGVEDNREEYQTGENGMRINRDEKRRLDALIDAIGRSAHPRKRH